MPAWRECKLGDLLAIKHGYAFLGKHFANAGSHIVLTPGSFYDEGGFREKGEKEKWYKGPIPAEYVLDAGDVVVAMTEQAEGLLGSSAIIPRSGVYLHNQRLGLVRLRDESKTDRRFAYYLFNTKSVRQQIRASASGVKVRHTAPTRISEVRVRVPPFPAQRWIASILSSYDDLIENNTCRIKILEQMAHMLYGEWFVNFRFAGHEKTEMVDSQLGPIPDGWTVEKVGNRFTTVLGGTPSRSKPEFWESGTIPWINSGEVNKLRVIEPSEFITSDALSKSSAKLMPKRATVVAITGATLGQVSLLEIESSANQSVVGIYDHEGIYAPYLYLTFTAIIEAIIKRASGGAQQHINKEIVNDTTIVVPPVVVMNRFNEVVVPIFDLIASLFFKNATLRKTRDFLLPKLISGEITVNHLERSVSQTS